MAYKKRWDDFFALFDSDGSGFISLEDVKGAAENFTKTFDLKKGTKEYDDAFSAYKHFFGGFIKDTDENGDGKVTRDELSNACEKVRAAGIAAAPGWWRSANAELFQVVDQNNNGEISLQEMVAFTKRVKPDQSEESIRHAYEWGIKAAGTAKLNGEAFWKLNWLWGTSVEPNPELDVIFPYWKIHLH